MKNITQGINSFLSRRKYPIILLVFVVFYILYFSYFSILRLKALYASYYDLGIMHQTVYNTYSALRTGDWSRLLELTNPEGSEQITRMAIHNDISLALLAPFYFVHNGPETLLIIQTVVISLGAFALFKIAGKIFAKSKYSPLLSLVFSISYLLYAPLQRGNVYDFHAVMFATAFLLWMFYFWLVKKYRYSFLFFILSLISKEQVALTLIFLAVYVLGKRREKRDKTSRYFSFAVIVTSIFWFVASIFFIAPYFRGSQHFAVDRYKEFGSSPIEIITGIFTNPYSLLRRMISRESLQYLFSLLGPVGFLSLLSPLTFLIALPELAINLLSNNRNTRLMIYHYEAVIIPFIFISAIYGAKKIVDYFSGNKRKRIVLFLSAWILIFSLVFVYYKGPIPLKRGAFIPPFPWPAKEYKDVDLWAKTLRNEELKIASTGQLSPYFTSRRYFYNFSSNYHLADYVLVRLNEIYNYPEKKELIPVYERLKQDSKYSPIYKRENFEVYTSRK
ncbi:DUF2079 domain-containing protein [Candidatus Roizmanbacteria bacterium]|nr:DUF2079 domain-containing protein [Candidatus Roizmanbacteria bacterium]